MAVSSLSSPSLSRQATTDPDGSVPAVVLPSLFLIIAKAFAIQAPESEQEGPNLHSGSPSGCRVTGTGKVWGELLRQASKKIVDITKYQHGKTQVHGKEMKVTFCPSSVKKGSLGTCNSDTTSLLEVSCSPRQ